MQKPPASVNERFHRMTDAELEENRVYWYEKLLTATGPASAVAADKFLKQINKEVEKRGLTAPESTSEKSEGTGS